MQLLKVNNLVIGYDNKVINRNINFDLNEGDYLCIVGENGVGKSTLLKTLLKLNGAIDGEIIIDNSYNIGYLPQQSSIQKEFPASVFEIVLTGTLASSKNTIFYNKKQKQLALDKLKQLDILDLKNKSYKSLSSGQQQRVLLARALCVSDKILVLDEPTTGLDLIACQNFYNIIENLNKQGTSIIIISHDIDLSLKYASKILHIGKQKQLFFGDTKSYLQSDILNIFTRFKELND